ncbi:hypothetical protein L210DRAFT_986690 [Boletus edulis BED1]|uniref:Uncharacterized protein n=1 Tax=Boletus edulis BED1 TaxID=1328754 RepID=A0AAD4BJ92_BOLED|nr:hypothetical protein L210DRAFT_986690 [Boletus edulis BED1]
MVDDLGGHIGHLLAHTYSADSREDKAAPGRAVKTVIYSEGQDTSKEVRDAPGHPVDNPGGHSASIGPAETTSVTDALGSHADATDESHSDAGPRTKSIVDKNGSLRALAGRLEPAEGDLTPIPAESLADEFVVGEDAHSPPLSFTGCIDLRKAFGGSDVSIRSQSLLTSAYARGGGDGSLLTPTDDGSDDDQGKTSIKKGKLKQNQSETTSRPALGENTLDDIATENFIKPECN